MFVSKCDCPERPVIKAVGNTAYKQIIVRATWNALNKDFKRNPRFFQRAFIYIYIYIYIYMTASVV